MAIKRLYDTLVGATVNVNQLVDKTIIRASTTVSGITYTNNGDGSVTVSGTATANNGFDLVSFNVPAGHRLLLIVNTSAQGLWGSFVPLYDYNNVDYQIGSIGKNAFMETVTNQTVRLRTQVWSGQTVDFTIRPMAIDLTAMLGSTIADYLYSIESATAGAGVAKLREWGFLTGGYIPYNTGTLESVEATAHKMVGFNQFDGELVAGYWDASTGAFVGGGANWKACKNYIKCVPNTAYAYFATGSGNSRGSIVFYDADKNVISAVSGGTGAGVSLFTTPSNCRYFTFYLSTEFSDNICINLSSDRNGEYEPYSAHTYDLGTDTLRGLFKLDSNNELYADGDTKTSDGVITRKRGFVDLGTLNWGSNGHIGDVYEYAYSLVDKAYGLTNMLCAELTVQSSAALNCIRGRANSNIISVQSDKTTIASFKTAMSGVYLVYELATPTTEQSTPFQNPQICDPDGTEEYVTSNGVPVGHETRYQL